MEDNFDLQRLWSTNNEHGDNLIIGAYAGTVSLTVFKKGGNKPELKLPLGHTFVLELIRLAKEINTANPGTRLPFIQMVFDPNVKSYAKGVSLVFCKDDKRIFSLEVSSPNVSPMKFTLRGKGVFTNGSAPTSEEVRSAYGLRELLTVLDKQIPVAMMLSRYNLPKFPTRTGNSGPNKQHQTSEGYRKQASTSDPFKGGEADLGDLF